jgi:hypothetical protein
MALNGAGVNGSGSAVLGYGAGVNVDGGEGGCVLWCLRMLASLLRTEFRLNEQLGLSALWNEATAVLCAPARSKLR